jgi:hypothetical protein
VTKSVALNRHSPLDRKRHKYQVETGGNVDAPSLHELSRTVS